MEKSPEVLFEDNHLLVVNKPAVLATMGARAGEPSLLEACKQYIKTKYNKPGNVYLGVVSRLDAFVTGAIVFARTSKAASRLTRQFQDRTVSKSYIAIVTGNPQPHATLEHWLIKDDKAKRMITTSAKRTGAKKAILNYKLVNQIQAGGQTFSLLNVELLTGRKHQIRVQLSSEQMPIVGDRKYHSQQPFKEGIALHANRLSFEHPTTKTRITVSCDPPKYWKLGRFSV